MHLTPAELRIRIEALAARASAFSDESSRILMETARILCESEQMLGTDAVPRDAARVSADRSVGSDGGTRRMSRSR
jgi:hypothetical protein